MGDATDTTNTIGLTAEIVSAYVGNNTVASADIPALINQVHTALLRVMSGEAQSPSEPLKPAVPIKKSITPDFIVCLEDGKKFKSLKRHLRTQYNMTPEQYRDKWSLPADYPMVAPNYAAARSQLAKQMGLGQQRRRRRSRELGFFGWLARGGRGRGGIPRGPGPRGGGGGGKGWPPTGGGARGGPGGGGGRETAGP